MKRREFLTTSAGAGLTLAATGLTHAAAAPTTKDLIELRVYTFGSLEKQKAFDDFLGQTAVPALNRAGVKPVGVFKLLKADNAALKLEADPASLYILMPHKSAESVVTLIDRLRTDASLISGAAGVLDGPKADPPYTRFESSLLLGFDEAPRVEVPSRAATRLLQLRIYESHNDERALTKIAMFNEGGEIAIFKRCGLNIVFFGQALIGSKLPNLTYMVSFENEAAMKAAWDKFGQDPAWKTLREDPTYKDTVSTITNLVLRPTASSQI